MELINACGTAESTGEFCVLEFEQLDTSPAFEPLYIGQTRFVELFDFLTSRGFRLVDFYNPSRRPNGVLAWGDALFVFVAR